MPGSYDSNGVYIFAEDDSASPFSQTLNLLAQSVSDQIGFLRSAVNDVGAVGATGVGINNLAGVALGTGVGGTTVVASRFGALLHMFATIRIGTGGRVTGPVLFRPFTATGSGPWAALHPNLTTRHALGNGTAWDASANRAYPLHVVRHDDNQVRVLTAAGLDLSASAPMTWAVNDIISLNITLPFVRLS